jgi:hypothetical protein
VERIPILSIAREELAEAVCSGQVSPPSPIACSPWVAMSLLQKAIRRGGEDLALSAAATLLRDSPERLWRRCGVIAFEDIGVADIATTGKVVAALGGKTFRASLGGEWPVASTIVSAMARGPKCRAADDLLMIIERHPALEEARRTYATLSTRDLLAMATGSNPCPSARSPYVTRSAPTADPQTICAPAEASPKRRSTISSRRVSQRARSRSPARDIPRSESRSATSCRSSAPCSR